MDRFTPFNFKRWIDDHRHLLRPPVGNKMIWEDHEFIVMVVGGPNTRTDYHVNEGEEFYYQLEGDIVLKVIDDQGRFRDVHIQEGDIYLLPPNVPHSPRRPADTVGLVVERRRHKHEMDALQWYCERCQNKLYEESFHLENIERDLKPVIGRFFSSDQNTTCKKCGQRHSRE